MSGGKKDTGRELGSLFQGPVWSGGYPWGSTSEEDLCANQHRGRGLLQPLGCFLFGTTMFKSLLLSPSLGVGLGECLPSLLPALGVQNLPGFDPTDSMECGI